jgi:hypothetical protein
MAIWRHWPIVTLAMLALGCGVPEGVREVDGDLEMYGNASYEPEIVLSVGGGTYHLAMHMGGLQTIGSMRSCGPWVEFEEADGSGVSIPLNSPVPETLDPETDASVDVDLPEGRYLLRTGVAVCDWVIRMSGPAIALESVRELPEPS